MAAAEARALWQRTANRCFVQEDAKRAPKLACCQSSCATSKSVDAGPASAADESNQTNDMKKVLKNKMQDAYSKNSEEYSELSDMMSKYETVEMDPVSCSVSKKTSDSCLGSDYSWIEGDRTEPWWRTTDRDELAFFVSQKSLNHFENCDLPPPQKKYLRSHPCVNANDHKTKTTSFDWEAKSRDFSNLSVHAQECLNPNLMHGKQGPSAKEEILHSASNKSSSTTAIQDNIMEEQQVPGGDPSRAELMEALCHSQKRAREAEEAARQAYAEKEDLVKLFFKQASQIFAYKQWLQLLQLETLYFQVNKVNSKDQLISTLFPMALSSMSRKPRKRKQNFVTDSQEMQDQAKPDITTYAVAFALGLSLVGAGILLGWTVGWMLPRL
ncbi:uncharacterized protein LOC114727723 isoform X2 [Neltuma alba]|uniref:uncharacterized protein LOC114725279 isoform X2 n=1 Tax=Neltuma alba TaxID=207710 RepID=UPI0010A513A6|nr:uncharacterized protein LOC114725279 isoform X2 [Prosopis alba]XP_028770272.1 uncharacterized protein LOC114727723 isoform X2 [Prosopis alba]